MTTEERTGCPHSSVASGRTVVSGSGRLSWGRHRLLPLVSTVLACLVVLGACTLGSSHSAREAQAVIEEYLGAIHAGDMGRARSYWTDVNNPGGTWTMVARRDMEHVTLEHGETFAGGFEIIRSDFQRITGLEQPIGVAKLDVRVQPSGQIKKLEIGLVKHEQRWYIYSIYPGAW